MADPSVETQINVLREEIRNLRKAIYGNPDFRQPGVVDRLEKLEQRLDDLRYTYEKEKVEQEVLDRLKGDIENVRHEVQVARNEITGTRTDYRIAILYIKGIAAALTMILVALIGAIIVGLIRYFAAGGGI